MSQDQTKPENLFSYTYRKRHWPKRFGVYLETHHGGTIAYGFVQHNGPEKIEDEITQKSLQSIDYPYFNADDKKEIERHRDEISLAFPAKPAWYENPWIVWANLPADIRHCRESKTLVRLAGLEPLCLSTGDEAAAEYVASLLQSLGAVVEKPADQILKNHNWDPDRLRR